MQCEQDIVSAWIHLPKMFLSSDIFSINWIDPLHRIYIFNKGLYASVLRVYPLLCRGWTTIFLHGGPLVSSKVTNSCRASLVWYRGNASTHFNNPIYFGVSRINLIGRGQIITLLTLDTHTSPSWVSYAVPYESTLTNGPCYNRTALHRLKLLAGYINSTHSKPSNHYLI